MKAISELDKSEKATLLKSFAAGKVDRSKLTNQSLFCFARQEARDEANTICLGEASAIRFINVTIDVTDEQRPFKCLKTGDRYSFDRMERMSTNEDYKFVFADEATANQYLESIELFCGGTEKIKTIADFNYLKSKKWKRKIN